MHFLGLTKANSNYSLDPMQRPFRSPKETILIFRLKYDQTGVRSISKEDLEQLEKDIKDLGKWRKFRELKKDLET